MKYLFIFCGILFPLFSYCQIKKEYNTNIKSAKDVKIYSGKVNIGTIKVDSVIIKVSPLAKLILNESKQTVDTSGICTTTFTFRNPENLEYKNVNIVLSFDKPVISVEDHLQMGYTVYSGLNEAHTQFIFGAKKIESESISFVIKSKDKVFTTFSGIDGIAN